MSRGKRRAADGWHGFVGIRALRRDHHDVLQRETRDEQRAGLECVFAGALCASVVQSSMRKRAAVAHHRTNARVGYQRETL